MSKIPADIKPEVLTRLRKMEKRDRKVDFVFRRAIHYMEIIVAAITTLVLVVSLGEEILHMFTVENYFADLTTFLHHILTIVVGMEFVRMIVDVTPANILEVLTLAITRHVILSHDDPWSNVACILCIAGLFATRRFLIRHEELREELNEND